MTSLPDRWHCALGKTWWTGSDKVWWSGVRSASLSYKVSSADVWVVSNKDSQVKTQHEGIHIMGGPQLHSFFTSEPDESEWSASHPSRLNLEERAPVPTE